MKKSIMKKLIALGATLCMMLSFAVSASAAELTEDVSSDEAVIIGEFDGLLSECMDSDTAISRAVANVRINSYATYDEDDGIQVHVELYVPWYEFPKPEFTSMAGTVTVTLNSRSTTEAFAEFVDGESTIETDVDTGRTGDSGDKGTVSVTGSATANNALAGGGAFAISYAVTIP